MRKACWWIALGVALLWPVPATPGPATPKLRLEPAQALAALNESSTDALAGAIRGYLVHHLPPVLYEDKPGWGQTITREKIEWRGKGLHIHPERVLVEKNDGRWRHIRLTAENLADTLVFDIRHLQAEPGRITFDVFIAFDARLWYLQQNWKAGLKLYDGHTQARMRLKLALRCEATTRLEANGSLLPDAVVRLRVLHAQLGYDRFVVEHIAGIGGEAAKIIGEALKDGLHRWDPGLERNLLARADAAIVKAGDTGEVRVRLLNLLTGKR
ncbi:MAG: hypothetical protein NZ700_18225 [Gemmataceae bacterium]|nr:hypothetical protein [Gemmataceae bacterium]MDW8265473.1 hypothetical protein [Gemmataceae bacterium]